MELVKNIFFNTDKLIPNITVKISYTGKLFQDGATKVTMHYGFGEDFSEASNIEMVKSELGYQAEITLNDMDLLNLSFKNQDDEWDNNEGNNYKFNIEKPVLALTTVNSGLLSNSLRKGYIFKKKIRITLYKIINYLPKLITGNYKRKKEFNYNDIIK